MSSHFVAPLTDRLRLTPEEPDWIDLKRELTIGDWKALEAAALHDPVIINGQLYQPIDWGKYELVRVTVWATSWSLLDLAGQPAPLTLDAVRALKKSTFDAINALIVARVEDSLPKKKPAGTAPNAAGPAMPTGASSPTTGTS